MISYKKVGYTISILIHVILFLLPVFKTAGSSSIVKEISLILNSEEDSITNVEKKEEKIVYQKVKEVNENIENGTNNENGVKICTDNNITETNITTNEQSVDNIIPPKILSSIVPVYPAVARKNKKEGTVLLQLTIDENGNLVDIEILEDPGWEFVESAVNAVKKTKFLPAKLNDEPIVSKALLRVRYELDDN